MALTIPTWITVTLIVTMPAIAAATWFGFYRVARSLSKRPAMVWTVGAFLAGWLGAVFGLSLLGFFTTTATTRFPNLAYAFIPLIVGAVLLLVSVNVRQTVDAIPPHWIIGVQLYRVAGLLFLILYGLGQLPGEFAIPAGIGDVVIGLTAPIIAYLYAIHFPGARWLAIVWNVAGITDLVLAVTTGALTSPGFFQRFALSSPNLLITAFPLVLIPAFAVPLSILLHIFSLRVLLRRRTESGERIESQIR